MKFCNRANLFYFDLLLAAGLPFFNMRALIFSQKMGRKLTYNAVIKVRERNPGQMYIRAGSRLIFFAAPAPDFFFKRLRLPVHVRYLQKTFHFFISLLLLFLLLAYNPVIKVYNPVVKVRLLNFFSKNFHSINGFS